MKHHGVKWLVLGAALVLAACSADSSVFAPAPVDGGAQPAVRRSVAPEPETNGSPQGRAQEGKAHGHFDRYAMAAS